MESQFGSMYIHDVGPYKRCDMPTAYRKWLLLLIMSVALSIDWEWMWLIQVVPFKEPPLFIYNNVYLNLSLNINVFTVGNDFF